MKTEQLSEQLYTGDARTWPDGMYVASPEHDLKWTTIVKDGRVFDFVYNRFTLTECVDENTLIRTFKYEKVDHE